jgi:hypothetical protein
MPVKKDLIVIEEVTELISGKLVCDGTKKADRPPGSTDLRLIICLCPVPSGRSLTPQNFMDGVGEGRQWPA